MSTKVTIRHGTGFHLYSDALDDTFNDSDALPTHLYLTLEGVHVQLDTSPASGPTVTLRLPRELAVEVGLTRATQP